MNIKPILLTASLMLLAACEKEIDLNSHTVAPLYVCEATLTPTKVNVKLTTTRNVTQQRQDDQMVANTVVTITPTDTEYTDTLLNKGNGNYQLTYFSEEHHDYTLDICIDNHHYTSTSTLMSKPQVNNFRFVWQDMMSEKILFAELRLQDNADENNYYFMHVYRNNVGYRWAVMRDTQNPGEELQQLFSCCTKRQMDNDSDSDVLHDGDRIRLEVRSICRRAYDYLYSMQIMDNTGSNPVPNFTGGMLGYFSAFQQEEVNVVFHPEDIE